ncbi:hypothetical protein GCM10027361_24230 [Erwinia aphidicola]|jgi:hypothetical protein|uniref:Uncharacterized protein n=1 Tax=Erwinia aphidicola TaxID=68334 RepID=A0ABU8DLT2_ERWAP|nr:hypothetical protein [Erwinia aphidicola]MBD1378594.1 hypothetical protein [Erwinia aphidicola]
MKVKCIATCLTIEQKSKLGLIENEAPQYPFVIGDIYTVLGLHTQTGYYEGTILQIPMRYAVPAPLCLFEVVDDRPSKYWKIKKRGDNGVTLWPEELYREYFQDDLTDGVPEIVEIYNAVVERLEKEFD